MLIESARRSLTVCIVTPSLPRRKPCRIRSNLPAMLIQAQHRPRIRLMEEVILRASTSIRLNKLPSCPLDRLSRYEATLWRQACQILFTLQCLNRRKPWERLRLR